MDKPDLMRPTMKKPKAGAEPPLEADEGGLAPEEALLGRDDEQPPGRRPRRDDRGTDHAG